MTAGPRTRYAIPRKSLRAISQAERTAEVGPFQVLSGRRHVMLESSRGRTRTKITRPLSPRAKPRGLGRSAPNRRAPSRPLRTDVVLSGQDRGSWRRDQRSLLRRGLRFLDSARKDILVPVTIEGPWTGPESLTGVAGTGDNRFMPSASAFGRRWSPLCFALTLIAFLTAVACSSGAATTPEPVPRPSGEAPATSASNAPEATSAIADDLAVPVKVGSSVGEHIPDFELRLSGGSGVSSAALLGDRQPTFLFFFATW